MTWLGVLEVAGKLVGRVAGKVEGMEIVGPELVEVALVALEIVIMHLKKRTNAHKSWTRTKNDDNKSELDLIVDWLTVEGNYQKWRLSEMSKRDVCKQVLTYLSQNGFEDQQRDWRGVEQQVSPEAPVSCLCLLIMITPLDNLLGEKVLRRPGIQGSNRPGDLGGGRRASETGWRPWQ
jgi:hypothetical protein